MPTYHAGQRSDQVRLLDGAAEVQIHGIAGSVPGVTPLAAGGANGPGKGRLRQLADGRLQWRAPSSSTFGAGVTVAAGDFVLEDGTDAGAYLRVNVAPDFVVASPAEAEVHLQDVFNALGPDDVTAAEAVAGAVETKELTLKNFGTAEARDLRVWIDPAVAGLEISDDGVVWVNPTTLGTALNLGDLLGGASVSLHIRRTIGAGANSDPDVEHVIHRQWEGL